MSEGGKYSSLKKFTNRAWSYIIETPQTNPSLVAYARYSLPIKYPYKRPAFLELDDESTAASSDHEIRPIMHPKLPLLMNAGYAEVINAGKTLRTNEDQSCFHSFIVTVPLHQREESWSSEMCQIPCAYFAVFDGHAGTGASLSAYNGLHHHIKEKLTDIAHMLVLPHEQFAQGYLCTGLITSINAEQLIVGALEQAFVAMDDEIKQQRYDFRIDGGCTALAAVFMMGKLFVANAGDCRAVIYRDGKPRPMSYDHTPETERKRIQTLAYYKPALLVDQYTRLQFQHRCRKKDIGTKQLYRDFYMDGWMLKTVDKNDLRPQVISGEGKRARLLDTIGTTRGLGDHDLQVPYCADIKIKPFLTCTPVVRVFNLENKKLNENDILVMASDGMWEKLSNARIGEVVHKRLIVQAVHETRRYIVAAQTIVDEARGILSERGWRMPNDETGSYDDISAFVIPLYEWRNTLNTILLQHLKHIKCPIKGNRFSTPGTFTDDEYLNIPHESRSVSDGALKQTSEVGRELKQTSELDRERVDHDMNAINNSYQNINNIDITGLNRSNQKKNSNERKLTNESECNESEASDFDTTENDSGISHDTEANEIDDGKVMDEIKP